MFSYQIYSLLVWVHLLSFSVLVGGVLLLRLSFALHDQQSTLETWILGGRWLSRFSLLALISGSLLAYHWMQAGRFASPGFGHTVLLKLFLFLVLSATVGVGTGKMRTYLRQVKEGMGPRSVVGAVKALFGIALLAGLLASLVGVAIRSL